MDFSQAHMRNFSQLVDLLQVQCRFLHGFERRHRRRGHGRQCCFLVGLRRSAKHIRGSIWINGCVWERVRPALSEQKYSGFFFFFFFAYFNANENYGLCIVLLQGFSDLGNVHAELCLLKRQCGVRDIQLLDGGTECCVIRDPCQYTRPLLPPPACARILPLGYCSVTITGISRILLVLIFKTTNEKVYSQWLCPVSVYAFLYFYLPSCWQL